MPSLAAAKAAEDSGSEGPAEETAPTDPLSRGAPWMGGDGDPLSGPMEEEPQPQLPTKGLWDKGL
jgi:hypothetical protein